MTADAGAWLAAARRDASEAARAADVAIVPATTPDELDVLRRTMESIWGPEIVPPRNLLRGMALSGNCLLVAWRSGSPVGFALGWLGWDGGVHFHSHQVGVQADGRGAGIGYALKLAQRALCLEHGVTDDERHVVLALRDGQGLLVGVAHDVHADETVVGVLGGGDHIRARVHQRPRHDVLFLVDDDRFGLG